MKVLVTGGAGYIGSTTCSALIDAGHTPVIIDSLITGCAEFVKNRYFYEGDISDHNLLVKICNEHPDIDYCIHFAARIIISESVDKPDLYYSENLVKSLSLFNSLHLLGIKNIIFSSSASLYKTNKSFVVDENSQINPLNPYAKTKYAVEMALEDFCNAGYFHGISLRYFNPIGVDKSLRTGPFVPNPKNILGKLINTALGKEPKFYIMGTDWPTRDGTAIRDYIHVWDLARAHVLAIERFNHIFKKQDNKYCVINLGSGTGVTVEEFVNAFMKVCGNEILVEKADKRIGDNVGAYANCDKANILLGWKIEYSIEDGIKDMLRWINSENYFKLMQK